MNKSPFLSGRLQLHRRVQLNFAEQLDRETIFYSVLFTLWFVGVFFNPEKQFYESGTHATPDFVSTFKFIFSVLLFHGSVHITRIFGQIRKDSHGTRFAS